MAESVYRLQIPQGYTPALDILETEKAIKILKDAFEAELAQALHLTRVSAPLFVLPETGLNDNLNGVERPVSFDIRYQGGQVAEIVHSLAKWKRFALQRYGFAPGSGLYTDMNAVRRDEITDNVHSLYVDQWDWEPGPITADRRTPDFLKHIVRKIYGVFLRTQERIGNATAACRHAAGGSDLPHHSGAGGPLARAERRRPGNRRCKRTRRGFPDGNRREAAFRRPARRRAPDYDDWA